MEQEWIVPIIDARRCAGCGLCLLACANDVLVMCQGVAVVKRPALCRYEGMCALICPETAITLRFQCCVAEHNRHDVAGPGE